MSSPAETYETYMVPALFAPWASHLVDLAEPRSGERALDVACGTGIVARTLARSVGPTGAVVGLDLSRSMLEVASAAAMGEALDIELVEGRAESLPFDDHTFDLVTCQFGLMFFSDRAAALREMRRVLRPTGRIAVSVWQGIDRHPFYQILDSVIRNRLDVSSVPEYFTLGDSDRLRGLFDDSGFNDVDIVSESMTSRFPDPDEFLTGYIDVYTAAIPSKQSLDLQAREAMADAIRSDMTEPLRERTNGDQLVLPFHAHVARARP